jgi:hypothetical protein
MGMYDEIYVKLDLPFPDEIKSLKDWKNYTFQTKDLDNCLSEYIINEYNQLVEVITEREYIPYTEEERKKTRPWRIWKEVKEGAKTYRNTNYHGFVTFYVYDNIDEDTSFWVDFKATFTHGELEKIELVEFKKTPGRKTFNEEFYKKLEIEKKRPWNLFKKYASYFGWAWFWRNVEKLTFKVESSIGKLRMLLIRHML